MNPREQIICACASCSRVDSLDGDGRCSSCSAMVSAVRATALRAASRAIGQQVSALHAADADAATLRALVAAARACDRELEALTLGPAPAPSTVRASRQRSLVEDLELSVAVLSAGREVA